MERLKKAVTVILLIISCIFVTILVDLYIHPDVTKTAPAASPASIGVSATAGYPQDCNESVSPDPQEPFIRINPVPHHYIGEWITFTGTTNLRPEESLQTAVYSGEFVPCPKAIGNCQGNVTPCCGHYSAIVSVLAGPCGINIWSWDVNTSEHGFRPDGEYVISAIVRNGAVRNSSIFTVSGIPQPNITLNLPVNDPDEYAIRLSGQVNTGKDPDEKLSLTISTDYGRKTSIIIPVTHNETGSSWNYTLKKSGIVPYNFLTVRVSSVTLPSISIERTFLYNNEPSFYPYNPYSG